MASKRHQDNQATGIVKRKRSQDAFLAPPTLTDRNLLDDTFRVARAKEDEFSQMVGEFVIPNSFIFTQGINYMTALHFMLELPREVLFLAFDVLHRYLAKEYASLRGNRAPKRILCACILLAAKFNHGDGLAIRRKITTKSKVRPKVLIETERQVFGALDYRLNWWSGHYFLSYYADQWKGGQSSKEVNVAELVLVAAHHSRKVHRTRSSLNAAVCLNIATEIVAFSGANGVPLKRKRADAEIFDAEEGGLFSRSELDKCKRRIIKTIRKCKRKETHVYDMLLDECGADPVDVLQHVA